MCDVYMKVVVLLASIYIVLEPSVSTLLEGVGDGDGYGYGCGYGYGYGCGYGCGYGPGGYGTGD